MRISIPTVKSDYFGFKALADVAGQVKNAHNTKVVLDFSSCSFFEANMVAALQCVVARLYRAYNEVSLENMHSKLVEILRRNQYLNNPLPDFNETTIPFKMFQPNEINSFHAHLEAYLRERGLPSMSIGLKKNFQTSLMELFLNASEHSKTEYGINFCGQFFPRDGHLDISIADAGIGFLGSVSNRFPGHRISATQALIWALTQGNSAREGAQPGGLGLKLIKNFLKLNGGTLQIGSNSGFYSFINGHEHVQDIPGEFPGTWVNIRINTKDEGSYCLRSEKT